MGRQKEYEAFEKNYEKTVKDMLVLTSESVGGAGKYGKELWMPSAGLLGSVETESGLLREEGCLYWLVGEDERDGWIHDLKPLTIYRVKCREKIDEELPEGAISFHAPSLMLVEVTERDLHHPELDRIREDYLRPVEFTDELCGRFTLERRFDWFAGEVDWLGERCNVMLDYLGCDEESEEMAGAALAVFKKIYENLQEWDGNFRAFAAQKLTELANEWRDADGEEDSAVITEADFAERIGISEFSIDPEGDYTVYYYDDDMFYGHIIVIDGNVDGGMQDAYIAG